MVKLISTVLLYVTTINYAFNHSNLHLFCIYVANFIKIHRTVSEINVFKTWHLKCELSATFVNNMHLLLWLKGKLIPVGYVVVETICIEVPLHLGHSVCL